MIWFGVRGPGFMVRRSRLVDWPRGAIVDYDARFRATQRRYASARRPRSADALPQRSSRLGLGEQVQPERRFISFFDDDAQLRDEVVIRAATAGGTVVGADGSATPKQLPRNGASVVGLRQGAANPNNVDREVFCALSKFGWCHASRSTHDQCPFPSKGFSKNSANHHA